MVIQHYRILGTEVCWIFFLRACGVHQSTAEKIEKEIFCDDRSFLSLSSDLRTIRSYKSDSKNEVATWLKVYAGDVGCQMPHKDVVFIPYQDVKPVFVEYVQDMEPENWTPASQSYFS